MRGSWCAFALLALGSPVWAQQQAPLVRLELDLVDGSRIIGTPAIGSVPLQTPYAKMDIPLEQIATIQMGDDHETASVDLRNGDKVKGVIDVKPVELETVFGRVTIGSVHVRALRVVPTEGTPLPAELQNGLLLRYTFDSDEHGTVTDMSGKGRNGRRQGGEWVARGPAGGALKLAVSNDFVTVSDDGLPAGDAPRSLAWWFKVEAFPPGDGGVPLMAYGTRGRNNQWNGLTVDRRVGRCNFAFTQWGGVYLSAARVDPGRWYHVVYSYSGGGRHRFLVDGQPSGGLCEIGALDTRPGGEFCLGARGSATPSVITIDELCVYGRALSAEEAETLRQGGAR